MATQSRRKTQAPDAEQKEPIEKKESSAEEVVVVPASDYKKLLASLEKFMQEEASAGKNYDNQKIQLGESIQVISLSPGVVNAVTAGGENNGRVYRFREFGVSIEIPYGDLVSIVQNHFNWFEKGYLYINDARFIKMNGLEQITSKILTKEQMEEIVHGDSLNNLHLFEKGTPTQKEHMVGMLIDDINDGKDVDMNRIYSISKFVGYDISERAKEFKEWFTKPE